MEFKLYIMTFVGTRYLQDRGRSSEIAQPPKTTPQSLKPQVPLIVIGHQLRNIWQHECITVRA